jgi:hypothetical protein
VGAAIALGLVAVLGGFPEDSSPGGPRKTTPQRPAGPPPASPSRGTIRCSSTACTQHGSRVVPPIEHSTCSLGAQTGSWRRIDDDTSLLFACVPDESAPDGTRLATIVPDIAGARLDHAEDYLDGLGVDHDTSGGGPFGIIDSGNYTVCTTTPPAGTTLAPDTSVTLFVEGSC